MKKILNIKYLFLYQLLINFILLIILKLYFDINIIKLIQVNDNSAFKNIISLWGINLLVNSALHRRFDSYDNMYKNCNKKKSYILVAIIVILNFIGSLMQYNFDIVIVSRMFIIIAFVLATFFIRDIEFLLKKDNKNK